MAIALIVAAGRGERLGAGRPKAFVELGGRPLLYWSLAVLVRCVEIERIVVALPDESASAAALAALAADLDAPREIVATAGGASRSDSVKRALAAAGAGEVVLVHDAARPLLTRAIVCQTLAALAEDPAAAAAVAAAPVTDTIKLADAEHTVLETLARTHLWAVQTPQVFRRRALERALDVSAELLASASDDAWLIERSGGKVIVVPAGAENIKVTRALDLDTAERLLARRGAEASDSSGSQGLPGGG
jgi:2-C-methyl-D-erythritol 4-phosphate cytidylyltransferase